MALASLMLTVAIAAADLQPSDLQKAPTEVDAAPASITFRPGAAGAALGGLVLVDAAGLGASALIAAAAGTSGDFSDAVMIAAALSGVGVFTLVYGPGLAAAFAGTAHGRSPGAVPLLLAYGCQAAALALTIAAVSASGSDQVGHRRALLAGAAGVHFIGIPLALGLAPAPAARGRGGSMAPVAALTLAW